MQHEQHRVPVTALCLWNHEFVLSGEGPILNAYHAHSRRLVCSLAIFKDQQIHGIVTGTHRDSSALVWGGDYLCKVVVRQDASDAISFHPGQICQAIDWILDVDLSSPSNKDEPRAAILTAHNALTIWNLNADEHEERLDPIVPGSNCILYSAHVQWLSVSKCLVAAGTAFGDLIIWSCLLSTEDGRLQAQPQTHSAFSAHEGSVFGVHLSSSEVAYAVDGRKHLLASCSDDRTIKLWDVSNLSRQSPTLKEMQRETGFGAKQVEDSHAPPCLGEVMAHTSRIWHVRLTISQETQEQSLDQVRLWSFGEDASYIVWKLESSGGVGDQASYILRQCQTRKPHGGKNIWSLAIAGPQHVVTGGADGAIVFSRLAQSLAHQDNQLEIDFPVMSRAEKFKTYVFTGPNELVATTDQGRLLLLKPGAGEGYTSNELTPPIEGLSGYSVLSGCPGIAFVAGTDGAVYACLPAFPGVTEIFQTGKKVTGLFSETLNNTQGTAQDISLLITNVNSTCATFALLALEPEVTGPDRLTRVDHHELELADGFITTSFTVWKSEDHTYIALGSRHGAIALHIITGGQHDLISCKTLVSGLHCNEAITSLSPVIRSKSDRDPWSLLSTGRDGTYAAHSLKTEEHCAQFETVHQLSLPFGPNIEGLGYSPSGDMWIWGFRSTRFVVYNVRTQEEVFVVECGGVHRNWRFQINEGDSIFIWTKASKLYCERKTEASTVVIRPSGHGRDIKTISISPTPPHIIATGSEDTNIKLSIYDAGRFHGLHTLQMHTTGIQHLQWSEDGAYLFSSGGFEEFVIWKVTPGILDARVGVFCESTHPNSGKSDLRIVTFHARSNDSQPRTFYITTLYSDSSVKYWQYEAPTRSWVLLASGDYLTSCPTQCLAFGSSPVFLTASTDGHLTTWNPPSELRMTWKARQPIHQNAILSLANHALTDRSILVFSGGDDNALAITRYTDHSTGAAAVLRVPRAHTAAITGLAVFPDKQRMDVLWLVSASIDQRLKLWRVTVDVQQAGVTGLEIQRCANVFTAVADVSGVERIPLHGGVAEGILVVGVGMDVWRLDCLE